MQIYKLEVRDIKKSNRKGKKVKNKLNKTEDQ